jgi:sulfur-oxidizing protein SoxX
MRRAVLVTVLSLGFALGPAVVASIVRAEQATLMNERQMRRVLRLAFPTTDDQWRSRLIPDATMKACARWRDQPPKEVVDRVKQREAARITLPADGKFIGDWRRGEKIAKSGYGLRFTDTDTKRPNGGNCYACHELSPDEVSFGTLGVSLKGFGRTHKFEADYARIVYEKIFNSQAIVPCSTMPRFGANGILTIEQITDVVAYLMDPESPVNRISEAPPPKAGNRIDGPVPSTQRPRK